MCCLSMSMMRGSLLAGMFCLALLGAHALPTSDQQALLPLPPSEEVLVSEGPYKVRKELRKAEIIPTVIDDFLPLLDLAVKWSSKNYACLGNTLKPDKLKDAPSISLTKPTNGKQSCAGSKMNFIITLTDPDAPSRDDPKWSEMCHWIATGVTVSVDENCFGLTTSKLDEVMPYKPPGPPEKTGKHRYVFLAFAPANGTTDSLHLSKPDDRQHWGGDQSGHGVRDWARDNGLIPVAANFIYAQNDKQ